MFGLGKHGPDGRYGVIVDVGSGSVGIAIVASEPSEDQPVIIWSYRERAAIKDIENVSRSIKDIGSALVNAFLILGSQGFKALRMYDPQAEIKNIQVLISAPWSYTISKTISSHNDQPFEITKPLITELVHRAEKESLAIFDTNNVMETLDLEVVKNATIDIQANDYSVTTPYGQEAQKISLTHITNVVRKKVLEITHESVTKIMPHIDIECSTFMYSLFQVLDTLHPDTIEVCLLDITAEATELGIVRDGILKYVTHTPFGQYSLAREISDLCAVPKEEALGYVRGEDVNISASLSKNKQSELKVIIAAYEEKLIGLFNRTGDTLSIPKVIFVHTDTGTETFFRERIIAAAHKATQSHHTVHFVTPKLFTDDKNNDTALLLSAYVFHKKNPQAHPALANS